MTRQQLWSHASKFLCSPVHTNSDTTLLNTERQFDNADAAPETISSNCQETEDHATAAEENEALVDSSTVDFTESQGVVCRRIPLQSRKRRQTEPDTTPNDGSATLRNSSMKRNKSKLTSCRSPAVRFGRIQKSILVNQLSIMKA
jgi:hypothetical protein